MLNPWKVLGVHRKTPVEAIHKAYITLAKKHHPDLGGDIEKFRDINEAHEMLATKSAIQFTLNVLFADAKDCKTCKGEGCKSKSKGITGKVYTTCSTCHGSGLIIKEEKSNAIEL